eukprot:5242967-Pyramimonas_sp.AAC.1
MAAPPPTLRMRSTEWAASMWPAFTAQCAITHAITAHWKLLPNRAHRHVSSSVFSSFLALVTLAVAV